MAGLAADATWSLADITGLAADVAYAPACMAGLAADAMTQVRHRVLQGAF